MSDLEKSLDANAAPPGLISERDPLSGVLIDERDRPDFRDVFGSLASDATRIWTAVTRVRLSTMDLGHEELSGVEDFRVLVAELNALHLQAEVRSLQVDPRRSANLGLLLHLLDKGRLAVRAAPLAGWSPDFTVFSGAAGPRTVLIGTHWFGRPYPHPGPVLAGLLHGEAAHLTARRHAELWDNAHDVGPAVRGILTEGRPAGRAPP
jgi:hypothetical protein